MTKIKLYLIVFVMQLMLIIFISILLQNIVIKTVFFLFSIMLWIVGTVIGVLNIISKITLKKANNEKKKILDFLRAFPHSSAIDINDNCFNGSDINITIKYLKELHKSGDINVIINREMKSAKEFKYKLSNKYHH